MKTNPPVSRILLPVLLAIIATCLLSAAPTTNLPFGTWQRLWQTPILSPQGQGWESAGTFNPATVRHDGKIVMLYRAQDTRGTSRLGYADSTDGIHLQRRAGPVLSPEANYEKDGGVEDPRLVEIDNVYYLTYTGYNTKDAQLCLATSRDLIHWDRKGVILPAYKGNWNTGWTKSGAIVPEKIDGKYWMYFLGTTPDKNDQMGLAYSTDMIHWTNFAISEFGADDKLVYRTAIAVFDRKDPRKLIYRSEQPIFSPEKEWEKVGQVPNVVFVEGMVRDGDRYLFYYGGADKYVGVTEAPILK